MSARRGDGEIGFETETLVVRNGKRGRRREKSVPNSDYSSYNNIRCWCPELWIKFQWHFDNWQKNARTWFNANLTPYNLEDDLFFRLRWRYAFLTIAYFAEFVLSVVFICITGDLGVGMTLDLYVNQVSPIVPANPAQSALQQALNSNEYARGGFPILIWIPVYSGVYFVTYALFWYNQTWMLEMYQKYCNPCRYFPQLIATVFITLSVSVLTGERDILSLLLIAALVSVVYISAILIEMLVFVPGGSCNGDCVTVNAIQVKVVPKSKKASPATEGSEDVVPEEGVEKPAAKKKSKPESMAKSARILMVEKGAGCNTHFMDPNLVVWIRYWALLAFSVAVVFLTAILLTQIGLSFHQLPRWINALTLTMTLLFFVFAVMYMWEAKSALWGDCDYEAIIFFFVNEQASMWVGFLMTTIWTLVLMIEIHFQYNN